MVQDRRPHRTAPAKGTGIGETFYFSCPGDSSVSSRRHVSTRAGLWVCIDLRYALVLPGFYCLHLNIVASIHEPVQES